MEHQDASSRSVVAQYLRKFSTIRTETSKSALTSSLTVDASRSSVFHCFITRDVTRVSAYVLSSAVPRPVARKTSRSSRAAVPFCDSSAMINAGRTTPSSLCSNASTLS